MTTQHANRCVGDPVVIPAVLIGFIRETAAHEAGSAAQALADRLDGFPSSPVASIESAMGRVTDQYAFFDFLTDVLTSHDLVVPGRHAWALRATIDELIALTLDELAGVVKRTDSCVETMSPQARLDALTALAATVYLSGDEVIA